MLRNNIVETNLMDAAADKKSQDLKIKLMRIIRKQLKKDGMGRNCSRPGMGQRKKVAMVGISQPQISAVNTLRCKGFSVERLLRILVKLDKCVTITVDDIQLPYS